MKHIIAGLLLFASSSTALASADSVAVFFSQQKTVILINEHSPNRLHTWMDQMGAGNELHILTADESIKIDCGRTERTASCTFRLLPSDNVQFGNKVVQAEVALSPQVPGSTTLEFVSSRGDKFELVTGEGLMTLRAEKGAK